MKQKNEINNQKFQLNNDQKLDLYVESNHNLS